MQECGFDPGQGAKIPWLKDFKKQYCNTFNNLKKKSTSKLCYLFYVSHFKTF